MVRSNVLKSNKNFLEGVASKFGIPLYFWHDMGINCPQCVPKYNYYSKISNIINMLFTIERCYSTRSRQIVVAWCINWGVIFIKKLEYFLRD